MNTNTSVWQEYFSTLSDGQKMADRVFEKQ